LRDLRRTRRVPWEWRAMSLGSFEKHSAERSLENARLIYAAAICALASLPLVLSVTLILMWGA
jgi:hypothetical protein